MPAAVVEEGKVDARCWVCTKAASRTRAGVLLRGCACRGSDAGYAHLSCLIEAARHNADTWDTCPTCTQDFTGEVRLGLSRARWNIVRHRPVEDGERLVAADRLAQSLQECLGDHDGALPLLEEVLAVSRRVDGNDDENTLISMSNLASLHQKMGCSHRALPLFEEALASQRRVLGKEAPDTLRTISNLAMLHLRNDNFSLSLSMAEEAYMGRQKLLGNNHIDTLESMYNLGLLRWHMAHGTYVSFTTSSAHQGTCDVTELQLAAKLLGKALKGRRRVLGKAHHQTQESERSLRYATQKIDELSVPSSLEVNVAVAVEQPRAKKQRGPTGNEF